MCILAEIINMTHPLRPPPPPLPPFQQIKIGTFQKVDTCGIGFEKNLVLALLSRGAGGW